MPAGGGPRLFLGIGAILALLVGALSARAGILFTNLASFDATNGVLPLGLIQAPDGTFYGTALSGGDILGTIGRGTLFQLTPQGDLTALVTFDGTNGAQPTTEGLVLRKNDTFYGLTMAGGVDGLGTVYEATTNGMLTALLSFTGTNGPYPGAHPLGLTLGSDGNFYGTTSEGGVSNLGTVFLITPGGGFTNLLSFAGTNGASPIGRLLLTADGNFYGATELGGANGLNGGTIFRLTPDGALTTLFSFNFTNGALPHGGLEYDGKGNFYGSTDAGGISNWGTIFRWSPAGGFTNLVRFRDINGRNPQGELTLASDGNFYGTTYAGGTNDGGTVFKVTPDGVLTSLVQFTNGLGPAAGLTLGRDGDFYGTTQQGGSFGRGRVFRLSIPLPPVLQSITESNSEITLIWSAVAGQSYQLQSTADLRSTNWTDVGNAVDATNGSLSVSDPVVSGAARFYRVGLLP